MTTTPLPSPQEGEGNTFIEQLKALASDASIGIIKVLAQHKPTPVPISTIAAELGTKRSTTSMHLAKLHKVRLVHMRSRRKGYFTDTAQIKALIGAENYTRITQDLRDQNEDTPEQSQDELRKPGVSE